MKAKHKKQFMLGSILSILACFAIFPSVAAATYLYPYSYDLKWGYKLSGGLSSLTLNDDGDVFGIKYQVVSESPFWRTIDLYLYYDNVDNPYTSSFTLVKVKVHNPYDYIYMYTHYYGGVPKTTQKLYDTSGQYEYYLVDIRDYAEVEDIRFVRYDWPYSMYLYLDLVKVVYTSGGGGGCPYLSVYDGTTYKEEGLLYVHNPEGIDVIASHILKTEPVIVNNRLLLRLTEHEVTITHIDNVKFFGELANGQLIALPLISAEHSELGQVRRFLRKSDDSRVDLLGANHNNGVSQFVDLEYFAPRHLNFVDYLFKIEGYNVIIK